MATGKALGKLLVETQANDQVRRMFASNQRNQFQDGRRSSSPEESEQAAASRLLSNSGRSDMHKLSGLTSASVSPSSLQSLTTDSDSLQGELPPTTTTSAPISSNKTHSSSSSPNAPNQNQLDQRNKSPILIKYNYYDYNGERQENYDLQMSNNNNNNNNSNQHNNNPNRIQRQLSPTFKQSLDQIVSSQQRLSHSSPSPVSPPLTASSSASQTHDTMTLLARRYKLSSYEHRCLRCAKTVYQMDKVGPLKDFTFYHQNCFKCRECGTKLTLKTYFNNQHSNTDQEVYCHRHCPKTPAGRLDNQSVGIRTALNAPKVFDPILHQDLVQSQQHVQSSQSGGGHSQPQVDSRALHIRHAVKQTKLHAIYKSSQVDKKISQFLNRRLEYLEPKQKMLEMRHREEEEQLFKVFEQKWLQEESSIRDQIRDEWQRELEKLLEKYKRQLSTSFVSTQTQTQMQTQLQTQQPNNNNHHHHHELELPAANPLESKQQQKVAAGGEHQQINQNQQQMTHKVGRLDFHRLSAPIPLKPNSNDANHHRTQNASVEEERMIELERMNLEKTMTIKLDRKKETLKRKLKEFERRATAELVEKQSREMITLISLKLEEFKEEQKRKIGSDLEQFEAIESLANHLGASLQVSAAKFHAQANPDEVPAKPSQTTRDLNEPKTTPTQPAAATSTSVMGAPPLPQAPQLSKMDLYQCDQPDELFRDIDQLAINVAREDQRTFTDLVHHLTRHCLTDVEKVRAIFRWITVKNLNTMEFDSSIKADTPLGLLRGIKQGSESYHVLFKRLCSYAGLHCVVIKGYSKSAGYQPGFRFEGNRFRNSWNAVYVAGAWRFVQCNWGARHLVSVAVMQDKNNSNKGQNKGRSAGRAMDLTQTNGAHQSSGPNLGRRGHSSVPLRPIANGLTSPTSSSGSSCSYSSPSPPHSTSRQSSSSVSPAQAAASSSQSDSLRYEYDDHYFLTDPDEFIYEFFPLAPEWQLLRTRPISLHEFEQLPFVRSLFFKYGLYFPQTDIRSVLYTNSSGATTIKIGMPTHMIPSLIFHYNLKYFDSEREQHDGASLKRFVMQSVESGDQSNGNTPSDNLLSNIVSFRVHVPENGAYILDIFANSTTPNQYITGEPMKFKSVCKFKIIARNLKTVMVPLPDCASGEYGPMKATRLFGIIPLTHENGLISVQNEKRFLEIQFRMTRPLLDFMASLHKNGYDERQLSKLIKIFIDGDIVFIAIKFHEDGQYGLDVYTRDQQTQEQQHRAASSAKQQAATATSSPEQPKKQLLTHCCKYLINVRASSTAKR